MKLLTSSWRKQFLEWGHYCLDSWGKTQSLAPGRTGWHIRQRSSHSSSSFTISRTLQLVQEAAVDRRSSPQFVGTRHWLGAPTLELGVLVLSSWAAVTFGVFVGEKSYFPITTLVLKMLTQRVVSSWLQLSLSGFLNPFPCCLSLQGDCVFVVCLQTGAEAEPGPELVGTF